MYTTVHKLYMQTKQRSVSSFISIGVVFPLPWCSTKTSVSEEMAIDTACDIIWDPHSCIFANLSILLNTLQKVSTSTAVANAKNMKDNEVYQGIHTTGRGILLWSKAGLRRRISFKIRNVSEHTVFSIQ